MAKIIVKSSILKRKSGGSAARTNYVKYIATREGVEKPTERGRFVEYIANRLGAEKLSTHGLFTFTNDKIVLDRIAKEVENHEGNVWSHIISLRRDDAERMGYTTLDAWRELLKKHSPTIAEAMKIRPSHLKWYAAFHNKETNPHVHLIVYSTDPTEVFLTKRGIDKLRSSFANDIYYDELQNLYREQTVVRDMLREEAREYVEGLADEIWTSIVCDSKLFSLVRKLSEQMKSCKGKKVYGYLPKAVKATVNDIVKQLGANEYIAEMYNSWCMLEQEKHETYSSAVKTLPTIENNPVFKPIRNMVVDMVGKLSLDMSKESPAINNNKQTSEVSNDEEPEIILPNFTGPYAPRRTHIAYSRENTSAVNETAEGNTTPSCTTTFTAPTSHHVPPPPSAQKQLRYCAVQLFCMLSKMLSTDFCHRWQNERTAVDQKHRRQTREKKQALGARDEQSEEQDYAFEQQM